MKTPWQYAETGNEFSHQVALFMWANMAARFGKGCAEEQEAYSISGWAMKAYGSEIPGNRAPHAIPELQWLHAIKNQGHGDAIRGARSAMEGVKAGVPDIFLPVPMSLGDGEDRVHYCGLYVELKKPKTGRTSNGQDKWVCYLVNAGYAVEVCYGWEAARDAILKYLGR